MAQSTSKQSAEASAAGFEYQFERMLYHLATAGPDTLVGIETDDDIVVTKGGVTSLEQNKFVVTANKNPFASTSENLWKTLRIWAERIALTPNGNFQFLFATNTEIPKTTKSLIWMISEATNAEQATKCIKVLRETKSLSKTVSPIIDEVKGLGDDVLERIIINATIAENAQKDDATLISVLEPPDGIDRADMLFSMKGWIRSTVMNQWGTEKPGCITRQQYVNQKDRFCENQKRLRRLERPYRDIVVSDEDKTNCKSRAFVDQIHAIKLQKETEEIEQAIENYLRFYTENSRLLTEGEITNHAWGVFFDDIQQRWKGIQNRNQNRSERQYSPDEHGRDIYFDTLTQGDYKAPLDGQPTTELYLTQGGYHYLADDLRVYWHPEYPKLQTNQGDHE